MDSGRGGESEVTPSLFPQRYSLYQRHRRYLVEFRRGGQQVTHLWDPRKPFALGSPSRFFLTKEAKKIRLVDKLARSGQEEIAALKFHTPITLRLHATDAEPWIITLRPTAPFEPAAFRNPETLDIPDIEPPYYLYTGFRRRLFTQRQVGDQFRIQIGNTPVFRYEYTSGQHRITAYQEDVTWRNFEGQAQELIKEVPLILDNGPFLDGWVEWQQHWWRTVPLSTPEGTAMFVIRNQDPNFFTRNTGIAVALVAWVLWLMLPFNAIEERTPVDPATLSVSMINRFNLPLTASQRRAQLEQGPVRVKITDSKIRNRAEEEEATVLASSETGEAKRSAIKRERANRNGFTYGEGMLVKGAGALDEDKLQKTFDRKRDEIQTCYHGLQLKAPNQGGAVTLSWKSTRLGRAEGVTVKRSEIAYSPFQECLVKLVEGMDLPRPQKGDVTVDYPFYFDRKN